MNNHFFLACQKDSRLLLVSGVSVRAQRVRKKHACVLLGRKGNLIRGIILGIDPLSHSWRYFWRERAIFSLKKDHEIWKLIALIWSHHLSGWVQISRNSLGTVFSASLKNILFLEHPNATACLHACPQYLFCPFFIAQCESQAELFKMS